MNTENMNAQMTDTEKELIAAYRVGNTAVITRIFAEFAETTPVADTRVSDYPDAAERLASAIVGKLVSRMYLTKTVLYDNGFYFLMEDIAEVIRAELPDSVELEKLEGGK